MPPATPEGRAIEHEIKTSASPQQVRAAITEDDGLAAWYGPSATTAAYGEQVEFDHGQHPSFRWEVAADGDQVTWTCASGPGRSAGTTAVYDWHAAGDGRTVVRLTHLGWDADDDAYRRCNTYWGALLFQLERYLETGEHRPVFG